MSDDHTSRSGEAYAKSRVQPATESNCRTRVTPLSDAFLKSAMPADVFLKRAYEKLLLRLRPSYLEGQWDVLLAAVHADSEISLFRASVGEEPVSLVLGRHSAAQLRVRFDEALSLRHALALLTRDEKGALVLRLLDLSSSFGLETTDGASAPSLASNGSLAVRAADTALFAIFRGDVDRLRSSQPLPSLEVLPAVDSHPVDEGGASQGEGDSVEYTLRKSRVEACRRGGPYRSAVVRFDMSRYEGPASHHVYVSFEEQIRRYNVTKNIFRSGCLIGRDSRCHVVSDLFGAEVSRLHCLLIELDGKPMLFDLASMNGTHVNDQPFDHLVLSAAKPTEVVLSVEGPRMAIVPVREGNQNER